MAEANKLFHLALITPEALQLEADVLQAQFPAHDGSIGILTHRAPLLTKLGTGVLRLDLPEHEVQTFFISGGYAQMKDNVLTVLTDQALTAEQITPAVVAAEEAKLQPLSPADPATPVKRQAIQARLTAMRQVRGA